MIHSTLPTRQEREREGSNLIFWFDLKAQTCPQLCTDFSDNTAKRHFSSYLLYSPPQKPRNVHISRAFNWKGCQFRIHCETISYKLQNELMCFLCRKITQRRAEWRKMCACHRYINQAVLPLLLSCFYKTKHSCGEQRYGNGLLMTIINLKYISVVTGGLVWH